MPDEPNSATSLYTQESGYLMPENWQDLQATVTYYNNQGEDLGVSAKDSKDDIKEAAADYLSERESNCFAIPQERVKNKYSGVAQEHEEKYAQHVPSGGDSTEDQDDEDDVKDVEEIDADEEKAEVDTTPSESSNNPEIITEASRQKLDDIINNSAMADDYDEAVEMLSDIYKPYMNEDVSEVLRQIATVLTREGEIEEANEVEITRYALKSLVATYAQLQEKAKEQAQASQGGL